MKLRQAANDVMLRINDVALRANGTEYLHPNTKALVFGGLLWFFGEILRKNFVTTLCKLSGLEPDNVACLIFFSLSDMIYTEKFRLRHIKQNCYGILYDIPIKY